MSDLATRGICVLGMVVFMVVAWAFSTNRRQFPVRVVVGGLLMQIVLAFLILRTSGGQWLFKKIGDGFEALMRNVDVGAGFLFNTGDRTPMGDSLLSTFAFGVLPTVIFFSSLMSVLYHLGIMQWVVWGMAQAMRVTLGTTGPETLSAAANVFVGHTEAPLVVRPYLSTMTRSELCAMMTGGFATVTGGLLGAYSAMGIDISHLLTASVISAPAALLISKIMVPVQTVATSENGETASPTDANTDVLRVDLQEGHTNVIGAAVDGASEGMKLALNVGAMLIAFLALLALIDGVLGGICRSLDWVDASGNPAVSLGIILGYVGWPMAWLLGIPASECMVAGELIGLKTVANEFVAFQQLGSIRRETPELLSERSAAVLTYALAGFSNFAAIGIQVGGVGGMVPERRRELAELGLRAMFGGVLACCMTGAIAGLML